MSHCPTIVALILSATSFISCAPKSPPSETHLSDYDPAEVRLPSTTPFDNDVAMRAIYQNYYWLGYAEALRGIGSSYCGNDHPWYVVQFRGFSDGQRDGFQKRYAKEMNGKISN